MSDQRPIANRYELGDLLGQGGVGLVYRGTDTQTGQPVAIKLLRPEMVASHPQVVKRFIREAEALRALNHPNIVEVLATVQEDGKHYLVMEFVPGGSLRDVLDREGRLSIARTLEISLDLADALTRAHRLGIIHRDIKPANVLLAQDGTPRLTDFGMAHMAYSSRLTQTAMPMGTLHYLSPEACQGKQLDARADIWAFGVLLFEMLVGRLPFEADTPLALAMAITTQPISDLQALRSDVPIALTDLVGSMLEKDRERRIPSVRMVGVELEAIVHGTDTSPPVTPMSRFAKPTPDPLGRPKNNLPAQTTPFVGRETELVELAKLFADPNVRLVTVLGPGGMGKTRLALEAAKARLLDFAQGVFFVPLAPLSSAENIGPAIAEAVGFQFYEGGEPQQRLLGYLRQKHMLLVLDNYEHLLVESRTDLISAILLNASGVKILVTSREVLNLQEEWLFHIQGLTFPEQSQTGDLSDYAAVQLFAARARRVRRDFSLDDDADHVVRICQLVEGMPLALELAASWAKTMQCSAIAAEIQRGTAFLETGLRNIPARHRSMRAVFDQTWKRLTEKERDAFKRLSVFRGGFRHQAAEQLASASLPTLSALVDKSLLRWEQSGRYQVHELLRQCAEEQLEASPEEATRTRDLHCTYYADFLQERAEDVTGARQRQVIREINADLDNIRVAWWRAVDQASVTDIQKAAYTLYMFCDFQGRYKELADMLEKAIERLDDAEPNGEKSFTLAALIALAGWNDVRLGRLDEARGHFERSQDMYKSLAIVPPPGFGTDPSLGLGLIASIMGNYAEAVELTQNARQQYEIRADKLNLQIALYVLESATFAQGDYKAAQHYAQQAYDLTVETENRWMTAYVLSELGNVARALGDYDQARDYYQASYTMKQEFNDPEGMAAALNHLGRIAVLQEDFAKAKDLYQQSLDIYQEIYDRGGLATSLGGLGVTACAAGDYQAAQGHFQKALQISTDMQFVPLTLAVLSELCELLRQTGAPERDVELLTLVLHHPASDRETKDRARECLDSYQAELAPDVFAAAARRGQSSDLDTIVVAVLAELTTLAIDHDVSPPAKGRSTPQPDQPLLDPLTSRELEVLELIADGLTNQQIAETLVISVGTVKWYTSVIYSKLYVQNRTQAVAHARELGLLS